jgi:uncharacterized protein YdaU (DUF1376 family)
MPAPDRPPSFPLYVRDFLGDKLVQAMEAEPWPHGFVAAWGYTRLWLRSWEEPEPGVLPDDDSIMAALSGIGLKRWPRYRELIKRCFDTTSRPGFWIQKRVVREREMQVKRRNSAVEFGRQGGRKSVQGRRKARVPSGNDNPPPRHPQPPTGLPPAVASASAVALRDSESSRAKTELSAEPGAVPAGTAGSRNREELPTSPTGIGPIVAGILDGLGVPAAGPGLARARNASPPRGPLTGADTSTDEGAARERDAQLERLRQAEQGRA